MTRLVASAPDLWHSYRDQSVLSVLSVTPHTEQDSQVHNNQLSLSPPAGGQNILTMSGGPGLPGPVSPPPFFPVPPLGGFNFIAKDQRQGSSYQQDHPIKSTADSQLVSQAGITTLASNVDPSGLFFIDSGPDHSVARSAPQTTHYDALPLVAARHSTELKAQIHPSRQLMVFSTDPKAEDASQDHWNRKDHPPGPQFARGANCMAVGKKGELAQEKKRTKWQKKLLELEKRTSPVDTKYFYTKIIENKEMLFQAKEAENNDLRQEVSMLRAILEEFNFSSTDIDELLARLQHGQIPSDAISQTRSK